MPASLGTFNYREGNGHVWTRQARGRPLGHLRAAAPWAQGLMLYCTGATSNTVTLTFVSPALPGQGASYTTGNIVATHAVVFGPIGNIWASSGLVTVNITGTVTGMTFAAYLAPLTSGAKHNPFEMAGANTADY